MGVVVEYFCGKGGKDRFIWKPSSADWDTISALKRRLLPEMKALFGVEELGERTRTPTEEMRRAVRAALELIEKEPEALPKLFEFKLGKELMPGIKPEFTPGSMSGLRLPNDEGHFCTIEAGLEVCRLEQHGVGADGRGELIGEADLREVEAFETTNLGVIEIRSRPAGLAIKKDFRAIEKYLKGCTGNVVTRVLA